jgi:hypothetical protein
MMSRCGIGRRIAALSPPQNRTYPLPSMRLPGQEALAIDGQSRVAPRWVCLQPHGPYLTYAIVPLCSPFLSPDPLSHVSPLAGWVSPLTRPDPAGYGFPVPFGGWPSLLGTSSPPGVLPLPHGRATEIQGTRSVFDSQSPRGLPRSASLSVVGVGAPYTPGSGVRAKSYIVPSALTQVTVLASHRPVSERDGAS